MVCRVEEVVEEYKKDLIAANKKYVGQKISIKGKVLFSGTSGGNLPMIMFDRSNNTMLTIACYFPKELKKEIKKIESGSVIVITGTFSEKKFGDIIEVADCEVIHEEQ